MSWSRSGACWMSRREANNEYLRNLAVDYRSSGMGIDPFHMAGDISRFVAGRRPADVTWGVNQRALCGGLRCIIVDVEFAAVHDNNYRLFHAGKNCKRAAASIRRGTSVAATAGRNRIDSRPDSGR